MGNVLRNIVGKKCDYKEDRFPDNEQHDSTQNRSLPSISIPAETGMDPYGEKWIRFRARHAATDSPLTVEAHEDHTISTLKRHLIERMGMPFPSEDGKCKLLMVWNKPDLLHDEPLTLDGLEMDRKYLGGSIDHLGLGTYGLENGDYIMFTVMFPQLLLASANSFTRNDWHSFLSVFVELF